MSRSREPGAQVFALRPSQRTQAALAVAALSVLGAAVSAVWVGWAILYLAAGLGPAVYFLMSGVPRSIEVGAERVVVRFVLRGDRVLSTAALTVHLRPGELGLVHGNDTLLFGAALFDGGAIERVGEALAKVARATVRGRARW